MDTQNGNRPLQLKKIKRPINRVAMQNNDQGPETRANPFSTNNFSASEDSLNKYLDETTLPTREVRSAQSNPFEKTNTPQYLEEKEYDEEVYGKYHQDNEGDWLNVKVFVLVVCMALFVGIVAGKFIFGESKVIRNGLQGVVVNNEVPRGRARCGVAERTQGCVLYIMNPQKQEMRAKDFYDLASQMTGRQRFMIETGNMRYANSKINPGDIVQLNIPPL